MRPHPLGGKPGVDFAGDELRHYVRQISECELPLAQGGSAAKTTTIGLREDLDPAGEALLPDEADGYSLAIVAGRKARSVIGGAAPHLPLPIGTRRALCGKRISYQSFKGFKALPKRWIVERTFGWLIQSRRLEQDYEVLTLHSESMIYLSMSQRMLSRISDWGLS